jgi:hypothetical protein
MLENQSINVKRIDLLFSKSCLRDFFTNDTLSRIPKETESKSVSLESLERLTIVLKSIITSTLGISKFNILDMLKSVNRNPHKFLDLLKIINSYYS